jgi:nitroreductase
VSDEFPDCATIHAVLSLATRAPSVRNAQPWRWRVDVDTDVLHLHADPVGQLPHTDADERDLLISCGASLHHGVAALAALGWAAKVHRLPDPDDAHHLAALRVHPNPAADLDIRLAAAIPQRRTDRRQYSEWPIPIADIALLGARAARAGVMLRRMESLPDPGRTVEQAVGQPASDRDDVIEPPIWSGRYASSPRVRPPGSTAASDPAALTPAARSADAGPTQRGHLSAHHDGAVVALGTRDDTPLAWLRAGEATSLVLLSATTLGLTSCPLTEPLTITETRAAVTEDVFGNVGFPQTLIRIGWAQVNADPLPPTPRRPLAEVVEWNGRHGHQCIRT